MPPSDTPALDPQIPRDTLAVPVTDADHYQGPARAAVTLVEYGDYECPFCLDARPVLRRLQESFADQLRVVFRHFPLNSVHPSAGAAAAAAEAAASQGKFWRMHDALFDHQRELADVDLTHLALSVGLEVYRFQSDLDDPGNSRRVRNHVAGGLRSGVTGTPAFFVNGSRYEMEADFDSLASAVRAAAGAASPTPHDLDPK